MAAPNTAFATNALHRRLLKDIAEIQQDPFPNVHLCVDDEDFHKVCLILSTEAYGPLHLFIEFGDKYPLYAPTVTIQSDIIQPNVHGEYICASILNTTEGWTPAYTVKGIIVQLLSFFSSESLEQDYGGVVVDLAGYRREQTVQRYTRHAKERYDYFCDRCDFSPEWTAATNGTADTSLKVPPVAPTATVSKLLALPDEVVLLLLEEMPTNDILALADAAPFVQGTIHSYDFIRTRELQCFCLKKSHMNAKLGIGISITNGNKAVLRSEFDLLSQEAFFQHDVRSGVHRVDFDKWLPLPLIRRHWNAVKTNATACLRSIHNHSKMRSKQPGDADVLYCLMNNVVVQFSADAEKDFSGTEERSTLSHASEKAMMKRFLAGPRTKKHFPDLGHLLVAALISNSVLTETLCFHIIKEAILRNVVRMLDSKGADMAELAYLEFSGISEYRLVKTFEASCTYYRLLIFLKLFSSSARPEGRSLVSIREMLFDSHGAPPPGVSAAMARRIKDIRNINGFPGFLRAMGIKEILGKTQFTSFLRRTVTDSVTAGYSVMPLSQWKLYMIRRVRERDVEVYKDIKVTEAMITWYNKGEMWYWNGWKGRPTFFPGRKNSINGRRRQDWVFCDICNSHDCRG